MCERERERVGGGEKKAGQGGLTLKAAQNSTFTSGWSRQEGSLCGQRGPPQWTLGCYMGRWSEHGVGLG